MKISVATGGEDGGKLGGEGGNVCGEGGTLGVEDMDGSGEGGGSEGDGCGGDVSDVEQSEAMTAQDTGLPSTSCTATVLPTAMPGSTAN